MPLLPSKCYERKNIPQFIFLLFSLWNLYLNLSRSLGVHHLGLGYGVAKLDEQMGLINQVEVVNQG